MLGGLSRVGFVLFPSASAFGEAIGRSGIDRENNVPDFLVLRVGVKRDRQLVDERPELDAFVLGNRPLQTWDLPLLLLFFGDRSDRVHQVEQGLVDRDRVPS